MTMVTRDDVRQYVYDTLPWNELDDWDIDGIVDDMVAEWPHLIGPHPGEHRLHLGFSGIVNGLVDGDRYWVIVQGRQKT